ncbi:hypothetical protein, partial [Streptomyces asiaticus]
WAYQQAGVQLPRISQDQANAGTRISRGELKPARSGTADAVPGPGRLSAPLVRLPPPQGPAGRPRRAQRPLGRS